MSSYVPRGYGGKPRRTPGTRAGGRERYRRYPRRLIAWLRRSYEVRGHSAEAEPAYYGVKGWEAALFFLAALGWIWLCLTWWG